MNNTIQAVTTRRTNLLNQYLADSKGKSIFVTAATFIFFVVFMIIGILPTFRSILSQNRENKIIKATTVLAQKKLDDLKLMETESKEDPEILGIFDQAFPLDVSQDPFITAIYLNAETNRVKILGVDFPEEVPTAPAKLMGVSSNVVGVSISVKLEGTKRGLLEFISDLEGSNRIYNISSIRFLRKSELQIEEVGFDKEYDLTITLDYYYWRNNSQITI